MRPFQRGKGFGMVISFLVYRCALLGISRANRETSTYFQPGVWCSLRPPVSFSVWAWDVFVVGCLPGLRASWTAVELGDHTGQLALHLPSPCFFSVPLYLCRPVTQMFGYVSCRERDYRYPHNMTSLPLLRRQWPIERSISPRNHLRTFPGCVSSY